MNIVEQGLHLQPKVNGDENIQAVPPGNDISEQQPKKPTLHPRQKRVLQLSGNGLPIAKIGQKENISPTSVENDIDNVCAEFGVKHHLEAIIKALSLKIIEPPEESIQFKKRLKFQSNYLGEKEIKVLDEIVKTNGKVSSSKELSELLKRSSTSIDAALHKIYRKLDARSRIHAIAIYYSATHIPLGENGNISDPKDAQMNTVSIEDIKAGNGQHSLPKTARTYGLKHYIHPKSKSENREILPLRAEDEKSKPKQIESDPGHRKMEKSKRELEREEAIRLFETFLSVPDKIRSPFNSSDGNMLNKLRDFMGFRMLSEYMNPILDGNTNGLVKDPLLAIAKTIPEPRRRHARALMEYESTTTRKSPTKLDLEMVFDNVFGRMSTQLRQLWDLNGNIQIYLSQIPNDDDIFSVQNALIRLKREHFQGKKPHTTPNSIIREIFNYFKLELPDSVIEDNDQGLREIRGVLGDTYSRSRNS